MKKNFTRRTFIKGSVAGLAATAIYGFGFGSIATAQAQEGLVGNGSPLTVYFSHTGNTRYMAEQIHTHVGGDIVEVETVTPYPKNDGECHRVAKDELRRGIRPLLSTPLPDLTNYDIVFVGYPCWWGTLPMAMFTFMEQVDLSGKTVIPFTTHGGSVWGKGLSDMKSFAPNANLAQGLALYGSRMSSTSSRKKMENWLSGLGFSS